MTDWQPIATAPKDKFILLCQSRNGIIKAGRWSNPYLHWSTAVGPMGFLAEVTHWMPLPPPVIIEGKQ